MLDMDIITTIIITDNENTKNQKECSGIKESGVIK